MNDDYGLSSYKWTYKGSGLVNDTTDYANLTNSKKENRNRV